MYRGYGHDTRRSTLRVVVNGADVTDRLRTPEVTLAAAQVSRLPEVRSKLLEIQRSFARDKGVVMEGRDIGTVVFPNAPLKVFLKADVEERARRSTQARIPPTAMPPRSKRLRMKSAAATSSTPSARFRLWHSAFPDAVEMRLPTVLAAEQVLERILSLARGAPVNPSPIILGLAIHSNDCGEDRGGGSGHARRAQFHFNGWKAALRRLGSAAGPAAVAHRRQEFLVRLALRQLIDDEFHRFHR